MATATKTARSLALTCPMCGADDGEITLDLNNLEACYCNGCGGQFSPADAIAKLKAELAKWERVAAWISAAPVE